MPSPITHEHIELVHCVLLYRYDVKRYNQTCHLLG